MAALPWEVWKVVFQEIKCELFWDTLHDGPPRGPHISSNARHVNVFIGARPYYFVYKIFCFVIIFIVCAWQINYYCMQKRERSYVIWKDKKNWKWAVFCEKELAVLVPIRNLLFINCSDYYSEHITALNTRVKMYAYHTYTCKKSHLIVCVFVFFFLNCGHLVFRESVV